MTPNFSNVWYTVKVSLIYICIAGVCRLPCCHKTPTKMRYEAVVPTETYDGRRLSRVSSGHLVHHKRQRTWQWRVQFLFCCMSLKGDQQNAFADVSATLSDSFNYFRGYVPSDILAGIALLTLQQASVMVIIDNYYYNYIIYSKDTPS